MDLLEVMVKKVSLIDQKIVKQNTYICCKETYKTLSLLQMMPSITRFLIEGAELLHQDCSSMDRVMRYLEANLDTLFQHLNNENFSRTLEIVWEQLGEVLYELIQANLEVSLREALLYGLFYRFDSNLANSCMIALF